jgi:transcriptional regulator with GAF, ATPase, and Fis domain
LTREASSDDDETATLLRAPLSDSSEPVSEYALAVVAGADANQRIVLDGAATSRILVGQSPICDLRLADPEVSRRHLGLVVHDDGVRLSDLRSTNGTFVNGVRVVEAILRGGEQIQLGSTVLRLETGGVRRVALSPHTHFGRVVGSSPALKRMYPLFERLAQTDVPILIEGETGTGKEVLAESIHESSARSGGPFIVFDCTAVPPNLLESELFGHERGAFTGAIATRKGVFEQAHGGTLLIDEIGELEPPLQPKLLRALERSEVRRVGGDQWIRVDVRVIAATRRDLDQEVQEGRFRDDLYFRLAVARVELPALRERRGDVGVLARHFWQDLGGDPALLPYEVLERFERHDWPGNVRELRNAVARQLALGDLGSPLEPRVSPIENQADAIERVLAMNLPFPRARQLVQGEFERRYLERVLAAHGGNIARAAQASGIARRYFNLILARQKQR